LKPFSLRCGRLARTLVPLCSFALAGSEVYAGENSVDGGATKLEDSTFYARGRLDFGLESAYTFLGVANPFFAMAGSYNKNPIDYKLSTQILSLRYQPADPSGPSFLRGSWEISGLLLGSVILEGPESYFAGLGAGLRYYFVQRHARLAPFVEVRGAAGFTDSRGYHYAQQQDFTFCYMLGAGLRYDLNRRLSLTATVIDQHLSNAYLTRPNYGFDSVGFSLGVVIRY
jgi:Lipid A 3-O-deacylase (PagL)